VRYALSHRKWRMEVALGISVSISVKDKFVIEASPSALGFRRDSALLGAR